MGFFNFITCYFVVYFTFYLFYQSYFVYHNLTCDGQGGEKSMIFYQARHLNNPYPFGFIYAGENVVNEFEILDSYKWIILVIICRLFLK